MQYLTGLEQILFTVNILRIDKFKFSLAYNYEIVYYL